MGRRSLSDYLRDDASPLLPDGYWRHRPPGERLTLFRSLRDRVPDLAVGESYRLGGSLKLAPGNYTFYCSVPGHRQAGMEGTLSVS